MDRFKKLVVLEPIRFDEAAEKALFDYAEQVQIYRDIPKSEEEIIRRIGDADGLLVFYTSQITAQIIDRARNLRYIGMCCSLYTPQSANVDIEHAEGRGIVVSGIRKYGDRGVPEFISSELVRLFHGFGGVRWREEEMELTGVKVGIIGMGDVGETVADILLAFQMDVYYFSRTRKSMIEEKGVKYLPLDQMLQTVDIVTTHLHKHTIIMQEEDFEHLGNGKILVNTTFTAPYPLDALKKWLKQPGNYYIVDNAVSIGGKGGEIFPMPNVICPDMIAGQSVRSGVLLREKVLENMETFLENSKRIERKIL